MVIAVVFVLALIPLGIYWIISDNPSDEDMEELRKVVAASR